MRITYSISTSPPRHLGSLYIACLCVSLMAICQAVCCAPHPITTADRTAGARPSADRAHHSNACIPPEHHNIKRINRLRIYERERERV